MIVAPVFMAVALALMLGVKRGEAVAQAAVRARYDLETGTEFCEEPEAPFETKEAIYRIAQEALHNTVKHACARRLNLRLCRRGETIVLEVRDDGVGFDPQILYPGHLGLSSMRERAARVRGQLEVHSASGCGTCVRAEFSIPPNPTPSTPSGSPT
jgi:signal transduction histidine kinase